jgi:hypothetical protein
MECPICLEEYDDDPNNASIVNAVVSVGGNDIENNTNVIFMRKQIQKRKINLHDKHYICHICYEETVKKNIEKCCYCREPIDFDVIDIANQISVHIKTKPHRVIPPPKTYIAHIKTTFFILFWVTVICLPVFMVVLVIILLIIVCIHKP